MGTFSLPMHRMSSFGRPWRHPRPISLGQPQHRAPLKSGRGGVLAAFVVVRSRSVCFRGTLVALDRRVRGWLCGIRARNLCEFLSAAARPRRGGVRRASCAVALLVYIEGRAGTGVADGPSAVADGRLLGCHCFKGIRCRPRTAHAPPTHRPLTAPLRLRLRLRLCRLQVFPATRSISVVPPEASRINGARSVSTSWAVLLPTPSCLPTCAFVPFVSVGGTTSSVRCVWIPGTFRGDRRRRRVRLASWMSCTMRPTTSWCVPRRW